MQTRIRWPPAGSQDAGSAADKNRATNRRRGKPGEIGEGAGSVYRLGLSGHGFATQAAFGMA